VTPDEIDLKLIELAAGTLTLASFPKPVLMP
jgi:hypothetical protein